MDTWKAMLGNQVLVSAVVGWTVAQVLKTLIENPLKLSSEVLQQKLKEYVGHTPIQVVAGAILGIVLALVINNCY